jgi:hypothetical protein
MRVWAGCIATQVGMLSGGCSIHNRDERGSLCGQLLEVVRGGAVHPGAATIASRRRPRPCRHAMVVTSWCDCGETPAPPGCTPVSAVRYCRAPRRGLCPPAVSCVLCACRCVQQLRGGSFATCTRSRETGLTWIRSIVSGTDCNATDGRNHPETDVRDGGWIESVLLVD